MQTKFDVGDFLLLDNGFIGRISKIIVDDNVIKYLSEGTNSIINENELTPYYILSVEKYLKTAQKTLEIMKSKIGDTKNG